MVNNLLSAAEVFKTIGSILLAVLILLIMITVHEFGHWAAGKILKFKIDEFSIGFGPALFKHKKKKSDEVFALRLIPLGGYCSFHGEDGLEDEKKPEEPFPETAEEIVGTEPKEQTEHIELTKAEAVEPALTEPVEPELAEGEPARKKKKKEKRVPEWKQKEDNGAFTRKAPWKRIIVLVSGALMNYLFALLLIIICFFAYGQSMIIINGVAPTEDQAEAEYSFQAGDVLLQANGVNLYLTTDLARALNGKEKGDTVKFRVARNGKEEIVTIMLRESVQVKNSAELSVVWKALGVGVEQREDASYYMLDNEIYRFGFWETLGRSFVYSFKIAGSILKILGELLTGKLGISAVGGPVTTISMTSQIAATGFRNFLEISSFIGVNLAVFNLLPVPALDGSKVVFTVIEWIRGKPISRKIEAVIHAVGFVFLLGFAVLVDILQFV